MQNQGILLFFLRLKLASLHLVLKYLQPTYSFLFFIPGFSQLAYFLPFKNLVHFFQLHILEFNILGSEKVFDIITITVHKCFVLESREDIALQAKSDESSLILTYNIDICMHCYTLQDANRSFLKAHELTGFPSYLEEK